MSDAGLIGICSAGGGTSVGRLAVGIAKELGAHVVVSCSESSAETLKSLGADEVRNGFILLLFLLCGMFEVPDVLRTFHSPSGRLSTTRRCRSRPT